MTDPRDERNECRMIEIDPETRRKLDLKVFLVDDGGEYVWAICTDPEEARAISREYLRGDGDEDNEVMDPEIITELPMDRKLTLTNDEDDDSADAPEVTLTCAEWILRQGEGFLATTCF